ncbi:snapalysin [Umezawaea tangerina]|uniref:Extracellular small neutral protease n=1 Tax=Umezawaea tangerina TaxID=84725 RepID=A0A2T0SJZ1_9PSEU|nr:snapalysin [Umezawaea tangerina]
MFRKTVGALVAAVGVVGLVGLQAPAASADVVVAARTLTYNASGAAEFKAAVDAGAAVWNSSVANVKLVSTTSSSANIRVVADNGWPRAQTTSLGNGTVWMGREATNEGYNPTRIAAHELGHILGQPDRKPGPCTSLMSGSSAGIGCTNPNPNAREKAEVEAAFRTLKAAGVWRGEFVD